MSSKFIDAHEAARWVASGDTVCTVGMTLIGAAESILSAIEARFLTAGEPRDLTLLHAAGQSDRQRGIQHFAHPGMVTRLIGSHWGLAPRWMAMINNDEVEAWCLPQGQIVHLYSAMAAGLPGRLSPVGLGTFVDPRIEGGRMNARTRERPNLIEHVTFRGDEYLFYPALPLDVVIVRGTHADEDGNLTTDEEVMKLEVLHAVLAARRYGAKVLAQVKYRVAKGSLHPKSITVPGNLIDAIVVCEEPQTDYLTLWFGREERAKATGLFLLGVCLANIIGAPLGGLLLSLDGMSGWHGWQWMFFIEGLPAIALAFVVWRRLPDKPADARWLDSDDVQAINAVLAKEAEETRHTPSRFS
ncbi:MFS transporter, partial [Klebsiella sp. K769]